MDNQCPFCSPIVNERIIFEHGSAIALLDAFPVTEGHTLIVPRRHVPDCFCLMDNEAEDIWRLIRRCKDWLMSPEVAGFNVGVNCGVAAGQTIMHAHVHLIPRRANDTENPRGGVRGVCPEKMSYCMEGADG